MDRRQYKGITNGYALAYSLMWFVLRLATLCAVKAVFALSISYGWVLVIVYTWHLSDGTFIKGTLLGQASIMNHEAKIKATADAQIREASSTLN